MAARQAFLRDQGFEGDAVEVMLQDLAPSTIQRYEWHWKQFGLFCASKGVSDPASAGIETVVSYVDHMRRSRNYAYPTIKLCAAAVSYFLKGPLRQNVFSHIYMKQYLSGAQRLSVPKTQKPDPWDVGLVLQALRKEPFEPMESADIKWVSVKMAVLLSLLTAARGSEITALSVENMAISEDDRKVIVYSDSSFVPKTHTERSRRAPLALEGFFPYPASEDERNLHLLCPVRGLRIYRDRTRASRGHSKQLFVCYGGISRGKPVSKKRLAQWVTEGIREAYVRAGRVPPKLVAHSTRGAATSVAFLAGVDWDVIQDTACWAGERTFWQHYFLNGLVGTVARAVLEQALTWAPSPFCWKCYALLRVLRLSRPCMSLEPYIA